MLSLPEILRLVREGSDDVLVDRLLADGPSLPLAARLRLTAPQAVRAVALGLGLGRFCELTARPTVAAARLACSLIDGQRVDGSFGSVAATAGALHGLAAFAVQAERSGAADPVVPRVSGAIDRGLHALYVAQQWGGWGGLVGDPVDAALVLWLVGDVPAAAVRLDIGRLARSLAEAEAASGSEGVVVSRILSQRGVAGAAKVFGRHAA